VLVCYNIQNILLKVVKLKDVKCLGFYIDAHLRDDVYTRHFFFFCCLKETKNIVYRLYFTPMYGCQLWCTFYSYNYDCICIAYNNAFHMLHNISRYFSVRSYQAEDNITTFDALICKRQYSFLYKVY